MATVKIGDREFAVWDRQAPGGLGRVKKVALAEVALTTAEPADVWDRTAELVRSYLAEEVETSWLLDHLPADCREILRACIVASGGKLAAPGEAEGPQTRAASMDGSTGALPPSSAGPTQRLTL